MTGRCRLTQDSPLPAPAPGRELRRSLQVTQNRPQGANPGLRPGAFLLARTHRYCSGEGDPGSNPAPPHPACEASRAPLPLCTFTSSSGKWAARCQALPGAGCILLGSRQGRTTILCLTGEKPKAQRGQVACPRPHPRCCSVKVGVPPSAPRCPGHRQTWPSAFQPANPSSPHPSSARPLPSRRGHGAALIHRLAPRPGAAGGAESAAGPALELRPPSRASAPGFLTPLPWCGCR